MIHTFFTSIAVPVLVGVATVTGAGMIVPQVVRLHRTGRAEGVSAVWVGVGLVMNGWWLAYAAVLDLWGLAPVAVGSLGLYLVLAIQLTRIVGRTVVADVARGHLVGLLPAIGLVVDGWPGAGLVIGLLYGAVFAPAVWSALRSSSVAGISAATWWMAWVEAAIWLLYGTVEADVALLVGGTGGATMASVILVRLAVARPPTDRTRPIVRLT